MTSCDLVILVDDEPHVRAAGEQALELAGYKAEAFSQAAPALERLSIDWPGILVTDIRMPGVDGLELMARAQAIDPDLPVVLVTAHGDIAMAVDAMRKGAYDFIEKPFPADQLVEVVARALEKRALTLENRELRRALRAQEGIGPRIVGRTEVMRHVQRRLLTIAETDADCLIVGETGVGKEVAARTIHQHSRRKDGYFVAINCSALPPDLIESELFGHEAGAFTGAQAKRVGKFEHSGGGTLFLDEIDSMPMAMQAKILRVLQERVVERLGSNEPIALDLRIVAATKIDLREAASAGNFREDLYYRLAVATVELPPLRERREDVPLLFQHFLLAAAARYERSPPQTTHDQLAGLMGHDWPGNVRELRNLAERCVLFGEGDISNISGWLSHEGETATSLPEQMAAFEKSVIAQALQQTMGSVRNAAEILHIPRKTLYDKLQKHGMRRDNLV